MVVVVVVVVVVVEVAVIIRSYSITAVNISVVVGAPWPPDTPSWACGRTLLPWHKAWGARAGYVLCHTGIYSGPLKLHWRPLA